jgi:hypothetical protein
MNDVRLAHARAKVHNKFVDKFSWYEEDIAIETLRKLLKQHGMSDAKIKCLIRAAFASVDSARFFNYGELYAKYHTELIHKVLEEEEKELLENDVSSTGLLSLTSNGRVWVGNISTAMCKEDSIRYSEESKKLDKSNGNYVCRVNVRRHVVLAVSPKADLTCTEYIDDMGIPYLIDGEIGVVPEAIATGIDDAGGQWFGVVDGYLKLIRHDNGDIEITNNGEMLEIIHTGSGRRV